MGILAVNVRKLRKIVGLTQENLAKLLDVGKTTINNIETGYVQTPPLTLLEKLAAVFNTTPDALLGKAPLDTQEGRAVYVAESIGYEVSLLENAKIIDTVFIDTKELHGYSYVGLKVNDNSMCDEKLFFGDTVIVRQNAMVKNGDVVAVAYNEHSSIIRKIFSKDNIVILKPCTNVGNYEEIHLDKEKDRIKVIGKVVKVIRDL